MNAIRTTLAAAAGVALLALVGCASTPPPTAQMAVAQAAVTHAVDAGSVEFAPADMALARDKMTRAHAALANKDNDTALSLAQQAEADAQLAEAKSEAAKAQRSAAAVRDADRALREEMARKPK